jgi:hypothetical protein
MSRPVLGLSVLFFGCVAVFVTTLGLPRSDELLIGSDGILYYCYTRSLAIDGDLDLANEYAHFSRFPGFGEIPEATPAGRLPNRMPIGLALLWLPFFLIGHAVAWLAGAPLDGYGEIHQSAVCLGSMIYGWLGLLASYRLSCEYADKTSALIAIVVLWFGSNVIYYMVVEPSMSHMASLAVVGTLIASWRFGDRRSNWHWAALGALGGAAALVRPQDGLFLLLPATDWAFRATTLIRTRSPQLRQHCAGGALMLGAALAVYSIQLWAWWVTYRSILDSSYLYGGAHRFNWLRPHLVEVLFSLRHGLFTWHPVYLAAAGGFWLLARRNWTYASSCLIAILLQVYIVAAWDRWWQGDAFGGRMFISCVPLFTIGLALVVERFRSMHRPLLAAAALALVLWNAAFLVQYRFDFVPRNGPITWAQLVQDKLSLPLDLWRRLR